jgi:uncharacterized protein YtpQ (UPF0354 family)
MRVALLVLCVSAMPALAQGIPTDEPNFTKYVAERLRKQIGNTSIEIKGPLTLSVGQLQANLDRVYSFCQRSPAGCAQEIDTYVKAAAQVHSDRSAAPTKAAVRVVVRTAQYVQTQGGTSGVSTLQPRSLAGGLIVLPALDTPRAIRMLNAADSTTLGLTANQIHELGLANLRKTLKPVAEVAKPVGNGQIGQLVGDFYHPSRLVLVDSWAPLANAQGGVLIVAAPTTDAVFYLGEDSPVAIDALRSLVKNVMSRAPNRLSDVLLRWTPKGWTIVQ